MKREYLTTRSVAQSVGVSINTIYRWLKAGKIAEPNRSPDNNYRLWTVGDVEKIRYRVLSLELETDGSL